MAKSALDSLSIEVLALITSKLQLTHVRRLLLTGSQVIRTKLRHGGVQELDFEDEAELSFCLEMDALSAALPSRKHLVHAIDSITDPKYLKCVHWILSGLPVLNFLELLPRLAHLSIHSLSEQWIKDRCVISAPLLSFQASRFSPRLAFILPTTLTALSLQCGSDGSYWDDPAIEEEGLSRLVNLRVLSVVGLAPPPVMVPRSVSKLHLEYLKPGLRMDLATWKKLPPNLTDLSLTDKFDLHFLKDEIESLPRSITKLKLFLPEFSWTSDKVQALPRGLISLDVFKLHNNCWSEMESGAFEELPPTLTALSLNTKEWPTKFPDNLETIAIWTDMPTESMSFPPRLKSLSLELDPRRSYPFPNTLTHLNCQDLLDIEDPSEQDNWCPLPNSITSLCVSCSSQFFPLTNWLPDRLTSLSITAEFAIFEVSMEWLGELPPTLMHLSISGIPSNFYNEHISLLSSKVNLRSLELLREGELSILSGEAFKHLPRGLESLSMPCFPRFKYSYFQDLPPSITSLILDPVEALCHIAESVTMKLPLNTLNLVPAKLKYFYIPINTDNISGWIALAKQKNIVLRDVSSSDYAQTRLRED